MLNEEGGRRLYAHSVGDAKVDRVVAGAKTTRDDYGSAGQIVVEVVLAQVQCVRGPSVTPCSGS
jgi:hypothetical protein